MSKNRLAIIIATSLTAIGMSASVAVAAQLTNNATPATVFAPPAAKFSVNYFTVDKDAGIAIMDANAGLKEGTRPMLDVADFAERQHVNGVAGKNSDQVASKVWTRGGNSFGGNHWTKPASAGQPVGIPASLGSISLKVKDTPAIQSTDKLQQQGLAQFIETAAASDVGKKNSQFDMWTGTPKIPAVQIVATGDAISVVNFAKPEITKGGAKGNKSTFYVAGLAVRTHNLNARTHEIGGQPNSGGSISSLTASMSG